MAMQMWIESGRTFNLDDLKDGLPNSLAVEQVEALQAELATLRGELGDWNPTQWMRSSDDPGHPTTPHIVKMTSPFYAGVKYAVRNPMRRCLNRAGEWEYEPLPSSRDDAFYERCRFDSLEAAFVAVDRSQPTSQKGGE